MEKKNFEYEGTILTSIVEFCRNDFWKMFGDIRDSIRDGFVAFGKALDNMGEPAIGAAAGIAGAAAVGAADAFLKGAGQNADEDEDERACIAGIYDTFALDRLFPEPHHIHHPLWEEVYG